MHVENVEQHDPEARYDAGARDDAEQRDGYLVVALYGVGDVLAEELDAKDSADIDDVEDLEDFEYEEEEG